MSWSILIVPSNEASPSIGAYKRVRKLLDTHFPDLHWSHDSECEVSGKGGFMLELKMRDEDVESMVTRGGYNHLRQFAALCRDGEWQIIDMQFGEPMDLLHPYERYEEKA